MVEPISRKPFKPSISACVQSPEKSECHSPRWYFSRHEIEECSPSRKDGIDLEEESQLRKLYCTFIQELGKEIELPQVAIACALMLCHRFYMRQSHAKNDWQTIATASIFLAGKLEETPRKLGDIVMKAYERLYKWDPSAPQRIRGTKFFDKQKGLIITAERLLMRTIAFDFDIQLPYRPLVVVLKKLQLYSGLAQVAWNFVNDWICTTLCLQYKPHYIAAGSLFLAAKFQKVKLPKEKGKVWWLEFDIAPKQLEEVVQQMVRFLEHDRKQAGPLTHSKISQCRSQSTVTSISASDSHSAEDITESTASGERTISSDKVLSYQTGGAESVVKDNGETRASRGDLISSYVLVQAQKSSSNADHIKHTLKRRRCQGAEDKIPNEALNGEIGIKACRTRKLENGTRWDSEFSWRNKRLCDKGCR
ncbi:hypothetical protein Tsubulata_038383 [Turnera subulata]|uniref:B-like cyclin n=1 Tax=Turnera subulata TaxID=218843 RepID=A0A9Q0JB57_9ROSI|nr:hypothetical protein Tsubulata_038383 [Turnera subulata]